MAAPMRAVLVISALTLAFYASCASTGAREPGNPGAAKQLERLKSLEGEWVILPEEGLPAGQTVQYRVIGNGTTLHETLFAGTPEEMVTIYHLDGPDLVLTHYCTLGNQPRMIAAPSKDPNQISFRFAGGTNIDPEKDRHMHEAQFTFVDEARFKARWTLYDGSKPDHSAEFTLARSWR
jgi:hypothetical protein